jgi:hypothetical protein
MLITEPDRIHLLANAVRKSVEPDFDPFPVVKLFVPFNSFIWLLSELDPENPDLAYGLCDLGFPELGHVYLPELAALRRGPLSLVQRDPSFKADKSLSAYTEIARRAGRIIT